MKSLKLSEGLSGVRPQYIEEASPENVARSHRRVRRIGSFAAIAAVVAAAILISSAISPGLLVKTAYALETAVFPTEAQPAEAEPLGETAEDFLRTAFRSVLGKSHTENTVFSPVNFYLELAVLAEISEGETQREILQALGAETMDALREKATELWKAVYFPGDASSCPISR